MFSEIDTEICGEWPWRVSAQEPKNRRHFWGKIFIINGQ
jgi:hypothetical protein